ncbi:MAG TPA: MSMEG_0569 family flavin-dependent oxidoreductase [Polyangiaceae bacterium]|nr:MSMEG_0569 family flavin-dependent oxidoreductase [Polyangiaceae bacterium]
MSRRHAVIVIGAGQAGLSVSYCLKQRDIEHVVLEAHDVAHTWKTQRWDSFCLVTPNWQCDLPGHPYAGSDPDGFMPNAEIVRYIEEYAARFEPPLRLGVKVETLTRAAGGFELATDAGTLHAEQVVVATGSYQRPTVPKYAAELPPDVLQIHSSAYRNAESLPPGEVLVVGSGQSGCQIAEDLHLAGRKVHLAVGNAPRCARRYRGKDVVEWLHDMKYYDIPIERHPNREQVRDRANHYVTGRDGGRDIDLRKFALEGMRLYGRVATIANRRIEFAPHLRQCLDGADAVYRSINRSIDAHIEKHGIQAPTEADYVPVWEPAEEVTELDLERVKLAAVVWSVGFRSDFGWVKIPVFDERGYPRHERGVTPVRGLYFVGLPWLHTWGSGRFSGVGRDALHLAAAIQQLTSHAESRDAHTSS